MKGDNDIIRIEIEILSRRRFMRAILVMKVLFVMMNRLYIEDHEVVVMKFVINENVIIVMMSIVSAMMEMTLANLLKIIVIMILFCNLQYE